MLDDKASALAEKNSSRRSACTLFLGTRAPPPWLGPRGNWLPAASECGGGGPRGRGKWSGSRPWRRPALRAPRSRGGRNLRAGRWRKDLRWGPRRGRRARRRRNPRTPGSRGTGASATRSGGRRSSSPPDPTRDGCAMHGRGGGGRSTWSTSRTGHVFRA